MTEKPGIYQIKHITSGKVYIGGTSNISKRWSRHRKDLRSGIHRNKRLQADWDMYGEEAFSFEVLELTGDLAVREQYWINTTNCLQEDAGYNVCPTSRTTKGVKFGPRPKEVKDKLSNALKGKCGCGITSPIMRGVDNAQARFTEEQIRDIRNRYGEPSHKRPKGSITYTQLANEYGVVPSVICEIIKRKTWSHVK